MHSPTSAIDRSEFGEEVREVLPSAIDQSEFGEVYSVKVQEVFSEA